MNSVVDRLMEERKKWRQNPPNGFSANPCKNFDGTINLFKWECDVPGPRHTPLEQNMYKFTIEFDKSSLNTPLRILCTSAIYHPNVHNGIVCSSLSHIWPQCGLKQILFSLQSFLESDRAAARSLNSVNRVTRKQFNEQVQNMKCEPEVIFID